MSSSQLSSFSQLTPINIRLFKAAKLGHLSVFTRTLTGVSEQQKSIVLEQTTPLRNTFLHIATVYGHHGLARFLVTEFPDLIHRKNHKGDTPLHIAARLGKLPLVEILVTSSSRSFRDLERNDLVNEEGNTALHEALVHKRNAVVDFFLTRMNYTEFGLVQTNKDGKSPVYLVVEAGDVCKLKIMLKSLATVDPVVCNEQVALGKSLIHAAILSREIILQELVQTEQFSEQDNPLHFAASLGFIKEVKYLLEKFSTDVLKNDIDGYCPIHLASKNGHVQIIEILLDHYPDATEFLTNEGQNILHIAAESGKDNVVKYILKNEGVELLLNERDKNGNTPVHLATLNWHPKVVNSLIWDKRVDLTLVNDEVSTALEVAEKHMEIMAPFRQRLTWMALMSAGTPRAQLQDTVTVKRLQAAKYEPYNMEYCKDRVNTLLLVSALVATVTFAAGFTMPGGNNSSSPHQGMAVMVHNQRFQAFVICDSIAMYSSIIVAVTLMWAQLGDLNLLLNSLRSAQRLLGFSLTMMSMAFMAGVGLVVTELKWLADFLFIMGVLSLTTLLALFVPLFLPYTSKLIVARYISYYPFKLLMIASES